MNQKPIRKPSPTCFGLGLALLAALVQGGCAGLPTVHYYVLETRAQLAGAEARSSEEGLAVGVESFQVDPPYDQDRIVYRIGPDSAEVGSYAYHRWAAPLSRMLPVAAATALHGTPGIRSIEPRVPGRDYGARLSGRILELGEIDRPGSQLVRARLALRLALPDGTEIWSVTLRAEEVIETPEVGKVVERMNRAVERALSGARSGLQAALTRVRDGGAPIPSGSSAGASASGGDARD